MAFVISWFIFILITLRPVRAQCILKKTCVRQVALDKWFPLKIAPRVVSSPEIPRRRDTGGLRVKRPAINRYYSSN